MKILPFNYAVFAWITVNARQESKKAGKIGRLDIPVSKVQR